MAPDLNACTRLLDMVARKLGHDYVLLRFEFWWQSGEKQYKAVFGQYDNYDTDLLELDGRRVPLKNVDAEGCLRSSADVYHELVELVYKTLERGGKLSDGKSEVDASAVPEFMIECALNGVAE